MTFVSIICRAYRSAASYYDQARRYVAITSQTTAEQRLVEGPGNLLSTSGDGEAPKKANDFGSSRPEKAHFRRCLSRVMCYVIFLLLLYVFPAKVGRYGHAASSALSYASLSRSVSLSEVLE